VILGALITGALAVTHVGPFHSSRPPAPTPSSDIRGTWNAISAFSGAVYVETLHITTEHLSTGTFSGTVISPVGVETMTGTVQGTTVSFVISYGSGTEHGTAAVTTSAGTLRMQGGYTSPTGASGTILATRASP